MIEQIDRFQKVCLCFYVPCLPSSKGLKTGTKLEAKLEAL